MYQQIKPAIIMLLLFTVLTGILYPLAVTISTQLIFPSQAEGSLLFNSNNQPIGSKLIGQAFTRPEYFWGRASATSPNPYNAGASSGSNQGPTNPALIDAVKARIKTLRDAQPKDSGLIPVDLVTASGSGLDPHISPEAAAFQINRVATVRHLPVERVHELVNIHTEQRQWGIFGEPRVNVLELNLALDKITFVHVGSANNLF